jgi:hypothetical protein
MAVSSVPEGICLMHMQLVTRFSEGRKFEDCCSLGIGSMTMIWADKCLSTVGVS